MPTSDFFARLLAAAMLAPFAAQTLAQTAMFAPIPDLPGGTVNGLGRAVSGDGHVVVGKSNSTNGDEAMRWEIASLGAVGLSDLAGGVFSSIAEACNFDGSVVFGQGNSATNMEAFRWTAAGGMVSLGFPASGGQQAEALGCSADGNTACGDYWFAPPSNPGLPPPLPLQRAFRWTAAGGIEWLGLLPGGTEGCAARAISADGAVIVGGASDSSGVLKPFRWTASAGMQEFAGIAGTARGISPNGQWIVGSDSASEGFRWSEATGVQHLGIPSGRTASPATDVSNDGTRVSGAGSGAALLWQDGIGWRTVADVLADAGVSTTGWTLSVCYGLSDDGTVLTGSGTNPGGQSQGWVAVIPRPHHCGSADFNHDADVGTDADIEAFFACLAGNCCALCDTADFNGDGDVGTDADIEAFFRVLGGGAC
jgi:uncharacterized membrane protein